MRDEIETPAPSSPWPTWPEGFDATAEDRRTLMVLSALRGITPGRLLALTIERGSAAATLAAIDAGDAGSEKDRAFARSLRPEEIESAAEASGSRFVTWGSAEYPPSSGRSTTRRQRCT